MKNLTIQLCQNFRVLFHGTSVLFEFSDLFWSKTAVEKPFRSACRIERLENEMSLEMVFLFDPTRLDFGKNPQISSFLSAATTFNGRLCVQHLSS